MNQPTITEQVNGYLLEFADDLVVRVSRLRTPSDGQVRGELQVTLSKNGKETYLLVPTQFNFSSERTRATQAKLLTDKLNTELNWREIFDYLGQKIPELARGGDTYVEVWTDNATPAPDKWLDGVIYKGVQNIIFGEKGAMKSTVAYLLALCLVLPWGDNPLDLPVPKDSVKVLVLDWETDHEIFAYSVGRLRKGMNIPICSLFYRRCRLPLMDDIEAIQTQILATGANILVIDSLGAAAGGERGELKGSEAALLFNSALRKFNLTTLIIGQTRKGDDDKKKTIFGSTYFTYYARNIMELCHSYDDYGDVQHLALFHRECNLGKKFRPLGLKVEFNEDEGISIEREIVSVSEFALKVSASTRILETLKGGKMSQKDLREALDLAYSTLSMAIKRLVKQGKIQKIDNEWGLRVQE